MQSRIVSGGSRCARPPATVYDRVAVGGGGSHWERGTRIPLGSLHVDPGGISYGSRGLPRSGAPPEFAHERATIPEGSQTSMRPRCGRRLAHVRGPGVVATRPPATLYDPVGIVACNHASFPGVVAALAPRLPYMTALRSVGENPVGSEARGSRWERCTLIPEGSHTKAFKK